MIILKKGTITAFVLAVFLVIIAVSYSGGGLPKEFPAPDFRLSGIFSGKEFSLSEFRGRPVVLYFFASW